jgi:hypothetical protein
VKTVFPRQIKIIMHHLGVKFQVLNRWSSFMSFGSCFWRDNSLLALTGVMREKISIVHSPMYRQCTQTGKLWPLGGDYCMFTCIYLGRWRGNLKTATIINSHPAVGIDVEINYKTLFVFLNPSLSILIALRRDLSDLIADVPIGTQCSQIKLLTCFDMRFTEYLTS